MRQIYRTSSDGYTSLMRFPPSFLDEIRNRVPVSAVVGRRVQLKKQGKEMAGLSPFTKEKTPSFFVNDDKRFYHCFSSGKHGDIFTFLMEVEGLSFPEAVERLAGEAGLPLPKADPHMEARERQRAGIYDVMEMAAKLFREWLGGDEGAHARAYLARRGLNERTQEQFGIGYAPGARYALKERLAADGVTGEQMVEAGLIIAGEDIPVSYDRFRDRVMFPITDQRNRVIAFGGRALSADVAAKYMNSPETPLFNKSETLFNLAAARKAAHQAGRIHVVEGYMDVIAMSEGGFANTVAPLGTALTEQQLALLWRMADEPVLCFDGDGAGLRAAHRAADLALPSLQPGKSLRFALLPEGQDPDDLLRDQGREALARVLESARSLVDIVWSQAVDAQPLETPEQRAAFEAHLRDKVRSIREETVRRHYGEEIGARVRELFARDQGQQPAQGRRPRRDRSRGEAAFSATRGASDSLKRSALVTGARDLPHRESVILLALVNHPALIDLFAEDVAEMALSHADLEALRGAIVDAAAEIDMSDRSDMAGDADTDARRAAIRDTLQRRGLDGVLARIESRGLTRMDWFAGTDSAESDAEAGLRHILALHRKINTLHKSLEAAEAACRDNLNDANWARLQSILAELEKAEGTEALLDGFGALSGRPVRTF